MTIQDFDGPHGFRAEKVPHTRQNGFGRAFDGLRPVRITSRDAEHTIAEIDGRGTRHRAADGNLPGERRPLLRRRLTTDDFGKNAGRKLLNRNQLSIFPSPGSRAPDPALRAIVSKPMELILASASPRRAELLRSAGFSFQVLPAEIDETPRGGESASDYAMRMAREKAESVRARVDGLPILAADTVVVARDQILGKPQNDADAARMLNLLSGAVHLVQTGVVLLSGSRESSELCTTRVHVRPLSRDEIAWYVASGEPAGKAGAYAIQGRAARFIEWIEGSWSNVVGLPIATVHRMLSEAGVT